MKRWLKRGGWILVLAALIFLAFCIFARAYLGADSGVKIPLIDRFGNIDLFSYTVYASEEPPETPEEPPPEETEPEEPATPQPAAEAGIEEPEPDIEDDETDHGGEPPEWDGLSEDFPGGDYFDDLEEPEETEEPPIDQTQTLLEIRDLLTVIMAFLAACIAGFIVYLIIKPLYYFIFF